MCHTNDYPLYMRLSPLISSLLLIIAYIISSLLTGRLHKTYKCGSSKTLHTNRMKLRDCSLNFLVILFPKLRFVKYLKTIYNRFRAKPAPKMQLPAKIAIGCGVMAVFIITFGWVAFPKILKNKIKSVSLLLAFVAGILQ